MEEPEITEHQHRLGAAKANLRKAGAAASARRVSPLVRQLLPEIEEAIAAGAKSGEICAALQEAGFVMKLANFQQCLWRARKKAKAEGNAPDNRKGGGQSATRAATAVARAVPGQRKDQGAGGTGKQRDPLAMPPRPKTFHWDPMERPVIEFVDDEPKK